MEHGKNLGEGINGQPKPHHVLVASEPGSQFIQLQIWELEVAEIVLVQRLSVLARPRQPGGDGLPPVAEDPFSCGSIQSFSQRREHSCDLLGRGFQTIQGRGLERQCCRGTDTGGWDRQSPACLCVWEHPAGF